MDLHPNHDWYVNSLIRATRLQDWPLRKSLDADLRKMSKERRCYILEDFRREYHATHLLEVGR